MITNVHTVTVFNGRTDNAARRKIYIPTVVKGVSYVEAKGSSVADNGVWSADVQYKIRIPLAAAVQDGRVYMPDLKYADLDDKEAVKYWTIQKGDLVIRGGYAGEASAVHEDELTVYAKEQGISLIRVTEYADNTSGGSLYMKHWRVGGK